MAKWLAGFDRAGQQFIICGDLATSAGSLARLSEFDHKGVVVACAPVRGSASSA